MKKSSGFHIYLKLVLLSLVSTGCVVFSSPPFSLFPLSYLALIPALHVLRSDLFTRKHKVVFGFLNAWFIGMAAHHWIYYAAMHYGGYPPWISILAVVLFGIVSNSEFFIAVVLAVCVRSQRWVIPVYMLGFIVVARLPGIKLFPWSLGAVQVQFKYLAAGYFFTGTVGMLALTVFMNYLSERAWVYWRRRDHTRLIAWSKAVSVSVLIISGMVFMRLYLENKAGEHTTEVSLLPVQGNIANATKLDAQYGQMDAIGYTIETYQKITEQVLTPLRSQMGSSPLFVIWPETAYPIAFGQEQDDMSASVDAYHRSWMSSFPNTEFIFGSYGYKHHNVHGVQNVIAWVRSSGSTFRYVKQRLLAFGEYLPLRKWLPESLEMQWPFEDFSNGGKLAQVWELAPGVRVLPNICYEVLFDSVSQDRFMLSANMLLNVTNDGWWVNHMSKELHLMMARERSAVAGVPTLRVTNTGVSAWIDAWGQVEDRLDEDQPQARLWRKTIATRPWGPPSWGLFQALCGWILGFVILLYISRTEQRDIKI